MALLGPVGLARPVVPRTATNPTLCKVAGIPPAEPDRSSLADADTFPATANQTPWGTDVVQGLVNQVR